MATQAGTSKGGSTNGSGYICRRGDGMQLHVWWRIYVLTMQYSKIRLNIVDHSRRKHTALF